MKKIMESFCLRKGNGVHKRKLKGMHFLIVPLFVVLVVQINHASAVTFTGTVYTDETSFTTAAGGGLTTEDFNSFTSDTPYDSSPLDVGDFTLSATGTSVASGSYNLIDVPPLVIEPDSLFDIDGTPVATTSVGYESLDSQFHITFDTEINWLGFDTAHLNDPIPLSEDHRTDVLIDGELVELSVSSTNDGFLGFFSSDGFTEITFIQVNNSDGFAIDNVQYKGAPVPEPATVTFLGLGLAGLAVGAARRKWKKKSVDKS